MENNEMNVQNNETIEPVVKQKSNKGLVVLIIILILMVLGLSGYLVYDKFITKNTKITNEEKETKTSTIDNGNKKILKKDESKEVVYTLYSVNIEKVFGKFVSNIPNINIDSIYAKKVNGEINSLIYSMGYDNNYDENGIKCKDFCSLIQYKYYLNDNILSLVVYEDGQTDPLSHTYYTYNIDIYTGEEITNKDLVKLKNIDVNDFSTKLSNTFKDAYSFDKYYPENQYGKEFKSLATQTYNETVDLKNCSIDNPMFLNENGELNVILGVYYYAGGEGTTDSIVNIDQKQFIYYEDYKM